MTLVVKAKGRPHATRVDDAGQRHLPTWQEMMSMGRQSLRCVFR